MTHISDLLKDDIIYGFSIENQILEVYQVITITPTEIKLNVLVGDNSDFYLMFPKEIDLEKPVLCRYIERCWWIYTTNIDSLKNLIEADWEYWPDQNRRFYFDEYLDMWSQTICEF